jgi:antitoxin component YwqK of YwqJK toxin-antitoxin module
MFHYIYIIMKLIITEEQNKKLFIPRKLSKNDSRYTEYNNAQPMVDGVRINQYDIDGNKTGMWESYWDNGDLESKGSYKNGKEEGYWETYHYNGQLESKGNYMDGVRDGYWEIYFDNGNLWYKGGYRDGLKDGIWESYWVDGKLHYNRIFKNGKLIKESPMTENKKS